MRKLLFILQVLVPAIMLGQDRSEELIKWSDSKKLAWADYKGRADRSSGAAASTATYLGIDYNFSPKGLTYKITCSFSKTKSWGLHKTDYILSHEQAHFDIAEIYARILHKKMAAYKFNPDSYQADLKKIYETVMLEKDAMQNKYDEETNHSINKDKQVEWLTSIRMLLSGLESYKEYY